MLFFTNIYPAQEPEIKEEKNMFSELEKVVNELDRLDDLRFAYPPVKSQEEFDEIDKPEGVTTIEEYKAYRKQLREQWENICEQYYKTWDETVKKIKPGSEEAKQLKKYLRHTI